MFDISWGEIAVLGAVGVAVTGKRDLPRACRFVGHQLGRVVGLLQGARARADRFAHHNELRALQNELRSGLRELDRVKTEIAVAASSRGVVGRGLGPTTRSANKMPPPSASALSLQQQQQQQQEPVPVSPSSMPSWDPLKTNSTTTIEKKNDVGTSDRLPTNNNGKNPSMTPLNLSDFDFHVADDDDKDFQSMEPLSATPSSSVAEHSTAQHQQELSPAAQSERAVMEEEWEKQGIGFRARAERGSWIGDNSEVGVVEGGIGGGGDDSDTSIVDTTRATGSELLEHLERQCLIFDQYDRVVGEQEAEMEQRIERIQKNRNELEDKQQSRPDNDTSSDR